MQHALVGQQSKSSTPLPATLQASSRAAGFLVSRDTVYATVSRPVQSNSAVHASVTKPTERCQLEAGHQQCSMLGKAPRMHLPASW